MPTDLPAGPALDELVAVQVMGWQRLPDSVDGLVVHRLYRSPAGVETSWLSPFSSNITHAWEVVERMNALHHEVHLTQFQDAYWDADFAVPERDPSGYGRGSTAAEAIGRAAIAAVTSAAALR